MSVLSVLPLLGHPRDAKRIAMLQESDFSFGVLAFKKRRVARSSGVPNSTTLIEGGTVTRNHSQKTTGSEPAQRRPRVLWLMQYAPHYREALLRQLNDKFDLTVSCVPCAEYALIEPPERRGYTYCEHRRFRMGLFWLLNEHRLLFGSGRWDAVICVEDMHYPLRYVWYLVWQITRSKAIGRWVWWGHWQGKRDWPLLRWLRRRLVESSDGALTYTEAMREKLISEGCNPESVLSSNNTVVSMSDFDVTPVPRLSGHLNLLYVGSTGPRKHLHRLVDLARRCEQVQIRIVGPGAESRIIHSDNQLPANIDLRGPALGDALAEHFRWCHCVVAPGHLGLLVTDAARFGRPILVDSSSEHAPEAHIAIAADQPFANWTNLDDVVSFIEHSLDGSVSLQQTADRLADLVKREYTVGEMVTRFARKIAPDYPQTFPGTVKSLMKRMKDER